MPAKKPKQSPRVAGLNAEIERLKQQRDSLQAMNDEAQKALDAQVQENAELRKQLKDI